MIKLTIPKTRLAGSSKDIMWGFLDVLRRKISRYKDQSKL